MTLLLPVTSDSDYNLADCQSYTGSKNLCWVAKEYVKSSSQVKPAWLTIKTIWGKLLNNCKGRHTRQLHAYLIHFGLPLTNLWFTCSVDMLYTSQTAVYSIYTHRLGWALMFKVWNSWGDSTTGIRHRGLHVSSEAQSLEGTKRCAQLYISLTLMSVCWVRAQNAAHNCTSRLSSCQCVEWGHKTLRTTVLIAYPHVTVLSEGTKRCAQLYLSLPSCQCAEWGHKTLRTTVLIAYPHVTVLREGTKQLQKQVHGDSIEECNSRAYALCVYVSSRVTHNRC
jgi:hypothetical protein